MRERDLRGMMRTGGPFWLRRRRENKPVYSTFSVRLSLLSGAESARETGGKPAVVCAKTDNKRS